MHTRAPHRLPCLDNRTPDAGLSALLTHPRCAHPFHLPPPHRCPVQLVKLLLALGCSLLEKNNKGHSAIIQASCGGHAHIVQWLIAQGASVYERDDVGNSSLLFAAWGGHISVLEWLLENGASLYERSDTGHTALLSAANSGKQEVVEWLMSVYGASLDDRNHNGDSALLLAAFGGHCNFLMWLLDHGCDFHDENHDGLNLLLSACNGGHREMVELLLHHGCSLEVATAAGYTPLILAACGGHLELIKWLVQLGCSLDARTREGDTPLLLACYCGHADIARWILETNGSVMERNPTGLTPLISAANGGKLEVVQLLLGMGSHIEEMDDVGYTPVLLAARRGFLPVVQHLVSCGANINATIHTTDETIFTMSAQFPDLHDWLQSIRFYKPLHISASVGSSEQVRRLLYEGEEPLELAKTNGLSVALGSQVTPLDVARTSYQTGAANPKLVHILRQAASPWTPSTHFLFGSAYRADVFTVMLIWARLSSRLPYCHLPLLPPELWFRIAAAIPRKSARALQTKSHSVSASLFHLDESDSGCDYDDMPVEEFDDDYNALEWS
jgi:ankyrin repeat protein